MSTIKIKHKKQPTWVVFNLKFQFLISSSSIEDTHLTSLVDNGVAFVPALLISNVITEPECELQSAI